MSSSTPGGTPDSSTADAHSGPPAMIDPPDVTVVTGAAGWLGTGLLAALGPNGRWERHGDVRALVRPGESLRVDGPFTVVEGDVTDPSSPARAFDRIDDGATVDVIHTAGVIHPTRSTDEFDEVNHLGTRHVVEAAERVGARRMVHVSSNSPFGTNADRGDTFRNDEPYHPYLGYGWSKMRAELAVLDGVDRGLDAVIVRPPWFYGPHQPERQTTFFTMVKAGRFPVLGDGGQRRSMGYIDNLVQGIVRAELVPTPPGRAWWIADARPYTVSEIVETVGDALRAEGHEVRPNRIRLPEFAGDVAERIDRLLQSRGRYHQQFHVLGEMNKTIAVDVSAATAELGYQPEVDLAEGMRRSVRWCRDQGIEL